MKNTKLCILFLALLTCYIETNAKTIYNTYHNKFSTLEIPKNAEIEDNVLCVENSNCTPLLLLDTNKIVASEYKYTVRIANSHNKPGKSYVTSDGSKKGKHYSTDCGLVFNYINVNDYHAVIITATNTAYGDDIRDKRVLNVQIAHFLNNEKHVIEETTLTKDVELYSGLNAISIDISNHSVNVKIGNKSLNSLFNVELPIVSDIKRVGCYVGAGASVKVERTVLSFQEDAHIPIITEWTKSLLDKHFSVSKNPFEGYWTYLDRDMKDDVLRIGGRYTIALVETGNGYDIIYVDGAQVKKSLWKTGMLKGRLEKTIFTDNFKGKWIDATFRSIDQDVYGTFESGVILNVKFPVYNSQIRFSKVL